MAEQNPADKKQEILERRTADGAMKYDHAYQDAQSKQWYARRHDDHTKVEKVN